LNLTPSNLYQPPFGVDLTLLLAILALLLTVVLFVRTRGLRGLPRWRQGLLVSLRFVALAALVWALAGPQRTSGTQARPVKPALTVMMDLSTSMAQKDTRAGGSDLNTRWHAARTRWLDPKLLDQLAEHVDLKLHGFDRQLRPLSADGQIQPTGKDTHVFGSIRQVIGAGGETAANRGSPTTDRAKLMLILSDGHDTQRLSDPMLVEQLRRGKWQVFAVPLGAATRLRDLHLMAHADADFLLDGQATYIHAQVHQSGFDRATSKVELFHEGRLIATQDISFDGAPVKTVRFRIQPKARPGASGTLHSYRIAVQPVEDESSTQNNSRWVFIQSRRDRLKIVLFEARPYWDSRFLGRVLRQDHQVNLTAVYGFGSRRVVTVSDEQAAMDSDPVAALDLDHLTQNQINQFDMIILGKGTEQFFGADKAHLLVDYVTRRGGTLIFARGKAFDQTSSQGAAAQKLIAPLEPIKWGIQVVADLRLKATESGQQNPVLRFDGLENTDAVLTQLPDMIGATRIQKEKAGSIVWLRQRAARDSNTPPMAAVAYQRTEGGGQVLAILTDGLWRWAFLPSSLQDYDSVYQNFWARTVRWLAGGGQFLPGQSMSLQLSQLTVRPDEPVQVTVATRYVQAQRFEPKLSVIDPAGKIQHIELQRTSEQSNQYVATLAPSLSGVHQVQLEATGMTPAKITSRLAVYDRSLETVDTSARPQTLKELTDATGGRCLAPDEADHLLEYVQRLHKASAPEPKFEDAFNQTWLFAILIAALGLEWFARRRWGLS